LKSQDFSDKFNQKKKKVTMSRPCKPAKRSEKCVQNHSEKVSMQSEASNSEVNEKKSEEKVVENDIESKSTIEKSVEDETRSVIKSEGGSGSQGFDLEPEISKTSANFAEEDSFKFRTSSMKTQSSKLGYSEDATVNGSFVDLKNHPVASSKSTGLNETINIESSAAQEETDDLDYIKTSVGPAIIKGLASVVIRQPADPINYFANFLLNYRYNQRLFEKREQDLRNSRNSQHELERKMNDVHD
jgi:hypothetical protein